MHETHEKSKRTQSKRRIIKFVEPVPLLMGSIHNDSMNIQRIDIPGCPILLAGEVRLVLIPSIPTPYPYRQRNEEQ